MLTHFSDLSHQRTHIEIVYTRSTMENNPFFKSLSERFSQHPISGEFFTKDPVKLAQKLLKESQHEDSLCTFDGIDDPKVWALHGKEETVLKVRQPEAPNYSTWPDSYLPVTHEFTVKHELVVRQTHSFCRCGLNHYTAELHFKVVHTKTGEQILGGYTDKNDRTLTFVCTPGTLYTEGVNKPVSAKTINEAIEEVV